jgi:hypothetical protein
MSETRRILAVTAAWAALISALYVWLDFDWSPTLNQRLPERARKLNVAYIPVT